MDLDIVIIIIGALFSGLMISVAWFINRRTHPKALWLLFFTEMWERFSFYGMRALLIHYAIKVLGYGDTEGNLQYGAYNALVYTMPLIGGWVADRYLGFRRSIILGGIIMAMGHLVLAIPSPVTFFFGLGLLISGNGFFKPNISSFLGGFYEKNDLRKDTAYSIFYLGINIGAFLGGGLCGYLGQKINWHLGFGVAGIFMMVGLATFLTFRKVLGDMGHPPAPKPGSRPLWVWYALAAGLVPVSMLLVRFHVIMDFGLPLFGVAAVSYVIWLSYHPGETGVELVVNPGEVGTLPPEQQHGTKVEREKIWAALSMIILGVVFWGFYEQGGGMLNLMADRNVEMNVGGKQLQPAMVNNAINPFYIVLLTPFFAWMWGALIRRKLEPAAPLKFGIAFLALGLGYWLFVMGGKVAGASGMIPIIYFLGGYLFYTAGELFLSPIGLSMISKLSPVRMVGLMMGMWFLSAAFGHHLAGWIGSTMAIPEKKEDGTPFTAPESLGIYMNGCQIIALVSLAIGVVIICLAPFIKRWMHGVK